MTQIKKFAWYGSSVAFAALLAVTLLVTGSLNTAEAVAATTAVTTGTVGGTAATLAVTDTDLDGGEVVIFTIIGGTGTGSFTSGGGQTLACADDISGGSVTTCDRNTAADTVTVQVTAATAGSILVQYAVYDGVDGADAGANGSSRIATLTANNPVGSIVLTRTPTSIAAAGGTSTITATITTTAGANVANGTTVSLQTTHGTFTNGCTAAGSQICTATVNTADGTEAGEVAGTAVVVLTGGGLTGTATITASIGTVTSSTTIVLSGTTATITVGSQFDNNSANGAFAVATEVTSGATPSSTTVTNGFRVTATLKDSGGNIVGGVTPTIASTTGGVTFAACSASSGTTGVSTCVVTAQPTTVGLVIPFTVTSGTIKGTGSWTVGATTTATITVAAADIAPVTVGTITATVADSSGNLIGDGTSVTLVVTAGSLLNTTALTVNGVASFQYVSPGAAQTANATALVGSITGSDTFVVGTVVTPPAETGSFTGTIAASGVSLVVFSGGTVEALAAAATDAGLVSVSLTVDGKFVVYIVGAPAFVNANFNVVFAAGIDASTPVIVKK